MELHLVSVQDNDFMEKAVAKGSKSGSGSQTGGSKGGKGSAGWASTTGNPSGGGRDNAPPKK